LNFSNAVRLINEEELEGIVEMRNTRNLLAGITGGKRLFGRYWRRWKSNI
jgi:hypothetical protein